MQFPILAVKIQDEANLIKLMKENRKRTFSIKANEKLVLFGDMDICVRIAERMPISKKIDLIYGQNSGKVREMMLN